MNFKTLDDINVTGKVVFVRSDLNVPLKDQHVTDTQRIARSAVTIKELVQKKAKVIVASHLGRPKGKDPAFSLKPVLPYLEKAIGQKVYFAQDCVGSDVEEVIAQMNFSKVLLLENLRFYSEEEKNDPAFSKKLSSLADFYVNDAFASSHRAHASIEGITHFIPSVAGRLLEEEIRSLEKYLLSPQKPVLGIVGGAKISTKLKMLYTLMQKTDALVIAGAMASTFLKAQGKEIGTSLYEEEMIKKSLEILEKAKDQNCSFFLPQDVRVAKALGENISSEIVSVDHIPGDQKVLDIGPKTIEKIKEEISKARTVLFNGPVGAFEIKPFNQGTTEIVRWMAQQTQKKELISVAGGGDSLAAIKQAEVEDQFTYLSTAGGAFLEWVEDPNSLPGLKALEQ